ncbi:MAG: MarR family winged helix-turn-helix transcriptional regulator [Pseudomonadota bacterium]
MVDSFTLRLYHASRAFQSRVGAALLARLKARGYGHLTSSQLTFLAELDCGPNHGAEIARRTGVSRQAVHKLAKDLEAQGILALAPDPIRKNQNVITFTAAGTALMAECRGLLAELDQALTRGMSDQQLRETIELLSGQPPE